MLNVNFINTTDNKKDEKRNTEKINTVMEAIAFENNAIRLEVIGDSLKKALNKKDTLASMEEQATYYVENIKPLEDERNTLNAAQKALKNSHSTVISAAENSGTDTIRLRRLFRIVASEGKMSHIDKIMISQPDFDAAAVYNAFELIHSTAKKDRNEHGNRTQSNALKDAYITISDSINNYVHALFGVKENEYTKKVSIKFNNTTLARLHELYVQSYTLTKKSDKENDGYKLMDGYKTNTLIVTKQRKRKGEPTRIEYDISRLNKAICILAYEYICK